MGYTTTGLLRERLDSCGEGYEDKVLQRLIDSASLFIEFVTGLWFESRNLVLKLDGRATQILQVPVPIIDVTKIEVVDPYYIPSSEEIEITSVVVYNRHLTQNLSNPDDRQNPKLTFVTSAYGTHPLSLAAWPKGFQNIQLTGSFGYTDYDPSLGGLNPPGVTPPMIRELCERLCLRDLPSSPGMAIAGPNDPSWYERWMRSQGRVTQEKVRDQSISYAAPGSYDGNITGVITGDPWIDMMLLQFSKTSIMRAY